MAVTVRIPTPLRSLTGGEEQVSSTGATVRAVIEELEKNHPGMRDRLLDDKGVRRFVNIYVGDEDIRFLDGLDTKLENGVEISIVPAIAGGALRALGR
jgi:sulfur-carrier protein